MISLFPGFDNIWFALGESRFNNPGLQMPELMSRTWANSGVVGDLSKASGYLRYPKTPRTPRPMVTPRALFDILLAARE